MEKLSKEDKLGIIEDALEVLYNELNDFAIRTDIPSSYISHVVDSITKLEKLSSALETMELGLLEKLKGDFEQND